MARWRGLVPRPALELPKAKEAATASLLGREQWKRLLHVLHPGDYRDQFPRVIAAYDRLYNTVRLPTFNAQLELFKGLAS